VAENSAPVAEIDG
jgi:hypothetical protein